MSTVEADKAKLRRERDAKQLADARAELQKEAKARRAPAAARAPNTPATPSELRDQRLLEEAKAQLSEEAQLRSPRSTRNSTPKSRGEAPDDRGETIPAAPPPASSAAERSDRAAERWAAERERKLMDEAKAAVAAQAKGRTRATEVTQTKPANLKAEGTNQHGVAADNEAQQRRVVALEKKQQELNAALTTAHELREQNLLKLSTSQKLLTRAEAQQLNTQGKLTECCAEKADLQAALVKLTDEGAKGKAQLEATKQKEDMQAAHEKAMEEVQAAHEKALHITQAEMKRLIADNAAAANLLRSRDDSISTLKASLLDLEGKLHTQQTLTQQAQAKLIAEQRQQVSASHHRTQAEGLQVALAQEQTANAALQAEISKIERRLKQAENGLHEESELILSEAAVQLEAARADAAAQKKELEGYRAAGKEASAALEANLASHKLNVDELRLSIRALESQLSVAQRKSKEMLPKMQQMQAKLQSSEEQTAARQAELIRFEGEAAASTKSLRTLTLQNKKLEVALHRSQSSAQELQQQKDALEAVVQSAKGEVATHKARARVQGERVSDSQRMMQSQGRTIDQLQNDLTAATRQGAAAVLPLQERVDVLERQIRARRKAEATLRKEVEGLLTQLEQAQEAGALHLKGKEEIHVMLKEAEETSLLQHQALSKVSHREKYVSF